MPGRRYFDDDADHLPSGMKRIGYDADTERYRFRQGNNLYLGEPGSFYGGSLKYVGRARDSVASEETCEEDEGESYPESSDPVPPYSENDRSPHASPTPNASSFQDKGEWGVAVYSISDTQAKPPDGTSAGATLKRRASRFKEAAASSIVAQGVVRRLTRKKRPSRAVTVQGDFGTTETPENSGMGRNQENTSEVSRDTQEWYDRNTVE